MEDPSKIDILDKFKFAQDPDHATTEFLLDMADRVLTKIRTDIKDKRLKEFKESDRMDLIKNIQRIGNLLIHAQTYVLLELEDTVDIVDNSKNLDNLKKV